MDVGIHTGWTLGSTTKGPNSLKMTWPGGMREAIRRPALLARRAGHLGVADPGFFSAVLVFLARSFQVLIDLFPLLKSSPAGPTFRQA